MTTRINRFANINYEDTQFKLVSLCLFAIPFVEILTRFIIFVAPNLGIFPGVFQPSCLAALGIIGTLVIALEWIDRFKNKTFSWGMSEGLYVAFILTTLLSMLFSKEGLVLNPDIALDHEGPVHFLAYYWLFYSGSKLKSIDNKTRTLYVLLLVSIINAVTAFLQSVGIGMNYIIIVPEMYIGKNFSFGFTHNPNNYGGLASMFMALSSGAFVFREKFTTSKLIGALLLITSCLLLYTTFTSRARLAIIGDIAFVAFFIIALIVIRKMDITKRFALLLGVFALVTLFTLKCTNFIIDNVQRTSYELGTEDVSYNVGSQRLYIWGYAWESIKTNWAFGVGINNFEDVFHSNPKWSEGMFYHSYCHNEYLHILATQGIGSFLTYMTAIIYAVISSTRRIIKKYDQEFLTWIFLGALIAFMAKSMFSCSVTNASPYMWIILGLCTTNKSK